MFLTLIALMITTRRSANLGARHSNAMEDTDDPAESPSRPRNPPYLPTPMERLVLLLFPAILLFGTIFSVVSPQTRSAPYDPITQSHPQDADAAPSYFARKSNVFNVFFVKRGWGWTTFAFYFFLLTHPSGGVSWLDVNPRRLRGILRWAAVTGWWFLVTQWCFGPPVIDRGFQWTGGKCDLVEQKLGAGGPDDADVADVLTAVACKAAGGKWRGGHDISGHVFLLVLGTAFLMQELGWAVGRWHAASVEERCVVMADGAVKSANVEADPGAGHSRGQHSLGVGGKTASAVAGLNLWMLLMTGIYFHTWFEKLTGLLTALLGVYIVYIVPRFVPAVRSILGMPGI